jgi:hypothetical protein
MSTLVVHQIAIEDLVLDPRNPRIAPLSDSLADTPPRDWIVMALGRFSSDDEERSTSTSYSSLRESIRASGGVMQPIIVAPTDNGKYMVIEGNTRVAIYLELGAEEVDGDWSSIPAIVRAGGDEKGEHTVRLQAHLVGPRPWRPYAKAKYLHELYHQQKLSMSEIHNCCGGSGRRREIEEYIQAFADIEEHYVPLLEGGPVDQSRFSAFVELQKPPVLSALIRHGHTKEDFAKWVNDSRFTPLNTVRQLPRILANPQAKQKFLTRNAGEAMRILEQPSSSAVINEATIEQLASALAVKMRGLSWAEAKVMIEDPESRASQSVVDCYLELHTIYRQLNPDGDE